MARYLGGLDVGPDGQARPRPVTIVDTGVRKDLDLRVVSPVEHFGALPKQSVWPSIYRLLGEEVRRRVYETSGIALRWEIMRVGTPRADEPPVPPGAPS